MPAHRITICALALVFGFPGLGDRFGRRPATAQGIQNAKHVDPLDRFAQIDARLPTPGPTRTASGAPGPAYWQQRVDYQIDATLNDDDQSIRGTCRIAYHNHSPHPLRYLWLQLDQNRFHPDSAAVMTQTAPSFGSRMSFGAMRGLLAKQVFDGGFKIDAVRNDEQEDLPHTIVDTMMRVDLPDDLMPGQSIRFSVEYHYNIIETKVIGGRGGYESFDDGNRIYEIAQWYPRLTAYTDYCGWQHKQFLGRGEFTLELGDYRVRLTVPDDMVVAATGTLQNPDQVYQPAWKKRLKQATKSDKPVFIVTPDEAAANESADPSKNLHTWVFHADNVRDFAFAASRKFIWDAMQTVSGDQSVMAMSFYPNEAEPLWSQYSTEAIVHTLDVYGRYAFHYPYPTAISVNGPVYGMEYPMICFNGPRPEKDGTYSKATKYGLISVIIHEVGHNFFPMIVNSDERQWTWMDEGLNTFLQYLTEQEWEEDYPSRRGEPEKITGYMKGGNQRAIMTGSEEILQFGANAYAKPATALNILRETILGRELFDFAFREYCRRWRFKRPTPADFFRTMEDASATDLDWFWHGWFYTTDHVDIAITDLQLYTIDDGDPDDAADRRRDEKAEKELTLSEERNAGLRRRIDWQPGLKDYYNSPDYDPDGVDEDQRKAFHKMIEGLDDRQRAMLRSKSNFYVATFENVGGLVMPIIVRLYFDDGSNEKVTIPAQIWRANSRKVRKLFITEKSILRIEVDPQRQTADVDLSNNHFPPRVVPSRFQLYKSKSSGKNPMQKAGLGKKESDKPKPEDAKEKQDDASE
ncbi:M1 family metallopeptidase [Crateriforma spongiae]|uniref:M1 family metallopeptidase n=1 Tax=Crateriforma spongiae TaxID=2724528 RepID=UPI0014471703|nr:M1 family metallopeptidase [Crateriforma spongiae]